MVKRKRAALLPTNIALLQNLIRRDPSSYREEFLLQFRHYNSLREIYINESNQQGDIEQEFVDLIGFISQMCSCYPKDTADFPTELANLLKYNDLRLSSQVREKIVQSLTMLRNKSVISSIQLIESLFPLLVSTNSKILRMQVFTSLISLMKIENQTAKNQKLNRHVQALLFDLLNNNNEPGNNNGLWATKIIRELWRKRIWDDSRTVEIMTMAASCQSVRVASSGVKFFLGKDREEEDEKDDEDDDSVDVAALRHRMQINKKTSKRGKRLDAVVKSIKKKSNSHHNATYLNFSAIQLLRNPQGFAETLFATHLLGGKSKLNLEQKILFVNLISRLIGSHQLSLPGIYSFFLKYLTPKQQNVTQFMAAAAQASHNFVPPDDLQPLVRKIANEFVSDGVAAEVCAAGINTIREIVSRAPHAIDKTLVQDLIEYKGSKSKSVMMAARSLITLYREIDPSVLKAKDRGKIGAIALSKGTVETPKFGVDNSTVNGIHGIALLQKYKQENENQEEENDNDGWQVMSDEDEDDSDSSDGWISVESDKDYVISDSSDDEDEAGDEPRDPKKSKLDDSIANTAANDAEAFMKLASTTILTPADFAKIEELKIQAGFDKAMGKRISSALNEEEVDADKLTGPMKYKQLREERIARAQEGKEDREKFGSSKGKRLADKSHSTTNREKARKKNFMMMIHKKDVQGKAKRSLRDKQKSLRAHISKQKKKGF